MIDKKVATNMENTKELSVEQREELLQLLKDHFEYGARGFRGSLRV